MKWDGPTMLLLLLVAGAGAYVITRPTQSEKNAELLKQIAKLLAAIAVLKGKLGKMLPGTSGGSFAPQGIAVAADAAAEAADAVAANGGGEGMWAKYTSDPDWASPYA